MNNIACCFLVVIDFTVNMDSEVGITDKNMLINFFIMNHPINF